MSIQFTLGPARRRLVAGAALAAVLVTGAEAASAASFSWGYTRWGGTEALVGMHSEDGTTKVNEVVGWCGWGEGADVRGPFWVNGDASTVVQCRFSLRDVTVQLG